MFGQPQQQSQLFGSSSFGSTNTPQQSSFGGGGGGGFNQPQGPSMFGQQPQPQQQQQPGGFGISNMGANQGAQIPINNPNGDYEIPRPPQAEGTHMDAISSMCWSPTSTLLCTSSWDGKVRCFDIQSQGMSMNSQFKAYIEHQGPVLDLTFKHDGSGCFSAGTAGVVKMWNFEANPGKQNAVDVGRHDGPIKACRWIPESNLLATAGWDRYLKYWDLRSANAVLQIQLPGRCDAMDVRHPYAVIATGGDENDRQVVIYNLANPNTPERVMNQAAQTTTSNSQAQALQKPLRKQFRSVAIFPDKTGFAISSIEGRCAIRYFQQHRVNDDFAFKCHRDKDQKLIYPVNSLAFHQQFGTFATAGSDGSWSFWDKDSKQRLKQSEVVRWHVNNNSEPAPILCSQFSSNGMFYAYAVSYDWSRGHSGNPNGNCNVVYVRRVNEDEIRPKNGAKSGGRF